MTVHLVETSEEDIYLAVAQQVAALLDELKGETIEGSRIVADCEALVAEGRINEYLVRIAEHLPLLISHTQSKDLETCLNIICHAASRVQPDVQDTTLRWLSSKLSETAEPAGDLRLQAMARLISTANTTATRFVLLLQTVAYAKVCGQADTLAALVKDKVELWTTAWQLSPLEHSQLYLAIADLFRACKNKKKQAAREAYKFGLKGVALAAEAGQAHVSEVKPEAARVVLDYITSPDHFQFDFVSSAAIDQLRFDPQYAPLHALLVLLLDGTVKDSDLYLQQHAALLSEHQMSNEDVKDKIRLMALARLACMSTQISLDKISTELDVPRSSVDAWVVRAVGRHLFEGKIDQVSEVLSVSCASSTVFAGRQWEELHIQLAGWRKRIVDIRGAMDMPA